jgi:hypothetical protein
MSAFGGKADRDCRGSPLLRSLLGVKQTLLVAAHMSLVTQSGHRRCSPIQNEVDLQNAGRLSASHGTLTSKAELGFEPHSALNNPDGGMVGAHAELPSS